MTESTIALPRSAPEEARFQTSGLAAEMGHLMQLYVGATQRLAELNSQAIDTSIKEQRAVALESIGERSPFGAWRLQASFALAGTAKAAAYWRHVNEIVVDSVVEAVNEAETSLNRHFLAASAALGDTATDACSIALRGGPPAASGTQGNDVLLVDPHGDTLAPRGSE